MKGGFFPEAFLFTTSTHHRGPGMAAPSLEPPSAPSRWGMVMGDRWQVQTHKPIGSHGTGIFTYMETINLWKWEFWARWYLGAGNSKFFFLEFSAQQLVEMIFYLTNIFWIGLVQPPTRNCWFVLDKKMLFVLYSQKKGGCFFFLQVLHVLTLRLRIQGRGTAFAKTIEISRVYWHNLRETSPRE